jgi:ribose transport system ATP-binding protein
MLKQHESSAPVALRPHGGPPLIELRDVRVGKLASINFKLSAGEVVGISGLVGSGFHDIALVVNGTLKPAGGEVVLSRPGLKRALVPPHRESQGGFGDLTMRENMAVSALSRWRWLGSLLSPRSERRACEVVVEQLSVKPNSLDTPFEILSGGNKQKVIFGRALLRKPDVYVLCEPTRGVDVETRSEIYRLIRELAHDGAAVLVVSSDAEDLFSVCDLAGLVVNNTLQRLRNISELTAHELELMV